MMLSDIYIPFLVWPSLYEVDSMILLFADGKIEATILSLR